MKTFAIVAGIVPLKEEVVCFNSPALFDHFIERTKYRPDISYTTISREDAAKLLVEHDGIGTGCYLESRQSDIQALREARSRNNMIEFAKRLSIAVSLQITRLETPRAKLRIVA